MSNWELYDLIEAMFPKEVKEFRKSFELEDDGDLEEGDLERILYNYCDIDLDQFYLLIEKLLPLCEHAKSELTGITYRGFGKDGVWLIKQEI